EAVQLCLPGAPVKAALPIVDERYHVAKTCARRPGRQRRLVRPARARKTRAQLGDVSLGDIQREGLWAGHGGIVAETGRFEIRRPQKKPGEQAGLSSAANAALDAHAHS